MRWFWPGHDTGENGENSLNSLNSETRNILLVHRIFSEVEESIEQDVKELLGIYLNGLKA